MGYDWRKGGDTFRVHEDEIVLAVIVAVSGYRIAIARIPTWISTPLFLYLYATKNLGVKSFVNAIAVGCNVCLYACGYVQGKSCEVVSVRVGEKATFIRPCPPPQRSPVPGKSLSRGLARSFDVLEACKRLVH